MKSITYDTPIAMLTVGQLQEFLKSIETKPEPQSPKNLVYGLRGIRELFNVSHATAQRLKDTVINDAVLQCGRKIIVDADRAMELFNQKK
jgi:hypothetical protein